MVKVAPDFWADILTSGSRFDHIASLWTWKLWLPTCFQTGMLFLQFLLAVSGPAGRFLTPVNSNPSRVIKTHESSQWPKSREAKWRLIVSLRIPQCSERRHNVRVCYDIGVWESLPAIVSPRSDVRVFLLPDDSAAASALWQWGEANTKRECFGFMSVWRLTHLDPAGWA